jgi:hypothetical protein
MPRGEIFYLRAEPASLLHVCVSDGAFYETSFHFEKSEYHSIYRVSSALLATLCHGMRRRSRPRRPDGAIFRKTHFF